MEVQVSNTTRRASGEAWQDWEDHIRRLAQKARESGVKLYRDRSDGRYYASSVSETGKLHYVTGVSCDCKGFIGHGRCMHHSALMVALGWVRDEDPDPAPAPATALTCCASCNGVGTMPGTVQTGPHTWAYDNVDCWMCNGSGEVDPTDEPQAA